MCLCVCLGSIRTACIEVNFCSSLFGQSLHCKGGEGTNRERERESEGGRGGGKAVGGIGQLIVYARGGEAISCVAWG